MRAVAGHTTLGTLDYPQKPGQNNEDATKRWRIRANPIAPHEVTEINHSS